MSATPDKVSPVALETATLALRKAHGPAFAAFLDALRAEKEAAIARTLSSDSEFIMEAKGGANALLRLLERLDNAEGIIAEYERRINRNRNTP